KEPSGPGIAIVDGNRRMIDKVDCNGHRRAGIVTSAILGVVRKRVRTMEIRVRGVADLKTTVVVADVLDFSMGCSSVRQKEIKRVAGGVAIIGQDVDRYRRVLIGGCIIVLGNRGWVLRIV